MTRLWPQGEAIEVREDRAGNVAGFEWHGHTHTITQVRQRWQVDADWWSEAGAVSRIYFAVTTKEGLLCVLYYDGLAAQWRLGKIYD